MSKKKKIVEKISLSGSFTLLSAVAICAIVFFCMIFFVKMYEESIQENVTICSDQAVNQLSNVLANYMDSIKHNMNDICEAQKRMGDDDSFFQAFLNRQEDIVAITVYDENGSLTECWSEGMVLKKNIKKNLSYVENLAVDSPTINISKPHVTTIFEGKYKWVITVSRKITLNNGKVVQIAMDLDFATMSSYIGSVGIGQHGYCYIIDNDNNIVYHNKQQLIYAGLEKENDNALNIGTNVFSNVIYTVQPINNSDWKVVGVCYTDEMITERVKNFSLLLLKVVLLIIVIVLLISRAFSYMFSKPAQKLAQAMTQYEGDTEIFKYTQIKGTREIGMLSESFENMTLRINALMEEIRREEITLRKTELKALQAQINPHFLYNTLDSIAWMCEDGRNQEAEEMVNSLARLFRISISKGHELITIENEVLHAQSYLKIQNYRYRNQFTYNFDIDESCCQYLCNKITLQPIIENAINHGIGLMCDEGEINIKIWQDENDIFFAVADNGVGMPKEQCKEILNKEPNDRTGIGIKNVNDRIKIYFGDEYGLTIDSELDVGTTVTIRIPKVLEGNNER